MEKSAFKRNESKSILSLILLSALISASSFAYAEPEYGYDEQNRIIWILDENDVFTSYSYDENGNRIKNDNSQSGRIDFDSDGKPSN